MSGLLDSITLDMDAGREIAVAYCPEIAWHKGDAPGVELTLRDPEWARRYGLGTYDMTLTVEQARTLCHALLLKIAQHDERDY